MKCGCCAAADKAKSIDPVKVALALEAWSSKCSTAQGNMRRRSPVLPADYISSLGERTEKEPFTRKRPVGLEARCEDRHPRDRASDHLQDGAAELIVALNSSARTSSGGRGSYSQAWSCSNDRHLHAHGVLFGMLLFLMASGSLSSSACSEC